MKKYKKTFITLHKRTLFAKVFGPVEKPLIKQYRTWQFWQRSTKTLIL